jgi:hypothetical protein
MDEGLSDNFDNVLEANINRMYESYRMIMHKAKVDSTAEFERLQLKSAVVSVSSACQNILDQIQELRMHAAVASGENGEAIDTTDTMDTD